MLPVSNDVFYLFLNLSLTVGHIFLFVWVVLLIVFLSLVFKTLFHIQKEQAVHRHKMEAYKKQLQFLGQRTTSCSFAQSDFENRQTAFYDTVFRLKDNWLTLRLIVNSLQE